MNGISSNYQISFGALVPKSKYSGKPKLADWQINQIKAIKKRIKLIDKALFEKECEINQETADSSYLRQLNEELGTLQKQREEAEETIREVKMGISHHECYLESTERSVQKSLKPLEKTFNEDYGTNCENFIDRLVRSIKTQV